MEYEIIKPGSADPAAGRKHPRVRIAGRVYPLEVEGGDDFSDSPRTLAHIEAGGYGEEPQAYFRAAREAGKTARFNWQGVTNSMGDHAAVTLPPPYPSAKGE